MNGTAKAVSRPGTDGRIADRVATATVTSNGFTVIIVIVTVIVIVTTTIFTIGI